MVLITCVNIDDDILLCGPELGFLAPELGFLDPSEILVSFNNCFRNFSVCKRIKNCTISAQQPQTDPET